MTQALVIQVRLHEGRYHGEGDWPPSPARLFQALVAGAGLAGPLQEPTKKALCWLEALQPPLLGVPRAVRGQRVKRFVPNNDESIKHTNGAEKIEHPWIFNRESPILYVWPNLPDSTPELETVQGLVDGLYQLGRGLDMAWAWADVVAQEGLDRLLASYAGHVRHPSPSGSGETYACPQIGSLESLERRYLSYGLRFKGKLFTQAPRPSFRQVAYDSEPSRKVYALERFENSSRAAWPLEQVVDLTTKVRDAAVEKLKKALPGQASDIDRILVGRKPDGSNEGPVEERVRILPLPSIGHAQTEHSIRRVLVEVPAGTLRAEDVYWAFSGLNLVDAATGELLATLAVTDEDMLRHYGVGQEGVLLWRSVTPLALPAARRRIEPSRKLAEAKAGLERAQELQQAAGAVIQSLRHAGIRVHPEEIRLQREPFDAKGKRVEEFSPGTRFAKERLWHLEIKFAEPISGPFILGDGRFLGLGLMAPAA